MTQTPERRNCDGISHAPSPMTPPLLSLPSEVLIEIFSYLHPHDIAACQRPFRQLNDTVSHSQLLRYLIRVGRAGLHDPVFPGYTIRQRIDALEKWEASWSNFKMIESSCQVKYMVPYEIRSRSPTPTCRVHDDFLIMTRIQNPRVRIRRSGYLPTRNGKGPLDEDNER